jgi:hypothetical protein
MTRDDKRRLFLPLKRGETRKRELEETIRYSGMLLQMIPSRRSFILFLNFSLMYFNMNIVLFYIDYVLNLII